MPAVARFLPILEYHCIAEKADGAAFSRSSVPPEAFARQVEWLAGRGFQAVTLAAAFGPEPLPAGIRPVVFTFDDGYLDVFANARPILQARHWPATVFCCPGLTRPDEPLPAPQWGVELMSHRQMRELAAEGWEMAGHTRTHPHLPTLATAGKREEMGGGRRELEDILGAPVNTFAYPYGDFDAECEQLAAECGFFCAVSTRKGNRHRPEERFRLRRIFMRPDTPAGRLAHRLGFWYDLHHRWRGWLGGR